MKYACISSDSHVIEPPTLWKDYCPLAFRDRAPKLERLPESDRYVCEGREMMRVGAISAAGKKKETVTHNGFWERDVPKGAYDPRARVEAMHVDGVDAEVVYPTISLRVYGFNDTPLQRACFDAYNAWASDFCKGAPQQLRAIGLVNMDDIEEGVAQVQRVAKLGLAGAMISIKPSQGNEYSQKQYDPFWAAAQDTGLPVSLHIGTDRAASAATFGSVGELVLVAAPVQVAIADIAFGGVFQRFPKLQVISAENDVGWVAHYLEHLDYIFYKRRGINKWELKGEKPASAWVREQAYFTFTDDHCWVPGRSVTGVDRFMWASDYPHNMSSWPNSQPLIKGIFDGVPEAERHAVISGNAAKLYRFN
ncbi:MAG: amidohydrolase [Dehalococcoidia bacterium]|nr:amidohydrolase [Dehalococcoidia bacterium]